MIDPATGAIISTASSSLTLLNALLKMCQEVDPKGRHPEMAEVLAGLPALALETTGKFIEEIDALRNECKGAGIDPKKNWDQLQAESGFFGRKRRRVLKRFQSRIDGIAGEISMFFDDLVAVANCRDELKTVSRSFEEARQQKKVLRKETDESLPLGEILENLRGQAEVLRANIGDLNRKRK